MEKKETSVTNKIRTPCEDGVTDADSNTKPKKIPPKIQIEIPPVDIHEDKLAPVLDIDMFDAQRNRCNLLSPQRKNKRPAMMGKEESCSKAKVRVVDVLRDWNDEPELTTESALGKEIGPNKAKVRVVSKLDVLKDWDDDPELPLLKTKSGFCNEAAPITYKLNAIRKLNILKESKNKSEPLSKTVISTGSKKDTHDEDKLRAGSFTNVLNEKCKISLNNNKGKYVMNEPIMHIMNKSASVKNPDVVKELSNESELQLSKMKVDKTNAHTKDKSTVIDWNDEPKMPLSKDNKDTFMKNEQITCIKDKITVVSEPKMQLLTNRKNISAVVSETVAHNRDKITAVKNLDMRVVTNNEFEPNSNKDTCTANEPPTDTKDKMTTVRNLSVLEGQSNEFEMQECVSAVAETVPHNEGEIKAVKNLDVLEDQSNEPEMQEDISAVSETVLRSKDESLHVVKDNTKLQLPNNAHKDKKHIPVKYLNIIEDWSDEEWSDEEPELALSNSNNNTCSAKEIITDSKDKMAPVRNLDVLKDQSNKSEIQGDTSAVCETVSYNKDEIASPENILKDQAKLQLSKNKNSIVNKTNACNKDKHIAAEYLNIIEEWSDEEPELTLSDSSNGICMPNKQVTHMKDKITALKNLDVQGSIKDVSASAVGFTVSHNEGNAAVKNLDVLEYRSNEPELLSSTNKISANKTNASNSKDTSIAVKCLDVIEDWNDESELGLLKNKNKSADTHKDTTAVDILKDWNYEPEGTRLKNVKQVSSAEKQIAHNNYRSVAIKALDVFVNRNNKAKFSVPNVIKVPAVGRELHNEYNLRAIVNVPKNLEDELISVVNLDEHAESSKNLDVPEDPEAKLKTVINLNFDEDPNAKIMSVINLDMDKDPRDEVRAVGKLDSGKHPLSKEIRQNNDLVKNLSYNSKLNKDNCHNEYKTATAINSNLVNKPCYIPKISFPKTNESPVVYRVIPIPKHFIDSNNPKKINYSAIKKLKESQVIKISNGGIVTTTGGNSCLSESMLKKITEQLVQKREQQRVVAKEECVAKQKEEQRITFAKKEYIVKQKEEQRPTAKEEYVVKQKEEHKITFAKKEYIVKPKEEQRPTAREEYVVKQKEERNMAAVKAVRELSCKICNKKFKYIKAFEKHETTGHVKEITYDCDECPRWFTSEIDLHRHKSFHKRFKKFLCKICKKKFKSQNSLNKHIMIHHQEEKGRDNCETKIHDTTGDTYYSCDKCPKWFTCLRGLQAHNRFSHLKFGKWFCKICNKKYKSQCTFNNHMMHHEKEMGRYNCATCGEGFFLKTQLAEHLSTHYQYSCSFCDEKLICLKDKIVHENTHVRNKQFECMICRKIFPNKYTYDLHLPIHEGNKIHKCKVCGLIYFYESNLNLHMRSHEVHVKYCDFCHKQFSSDSELKRHIDTHFGISHDNINTSETFESEQLTIENQEKNDEKTIQAVESFGDKETIVGTVKKEDTSQITDTTIVRTVKKEDTFQITDTVQNKLTQTDILVDKVQNCVSNSKEHHREQQNMSELITADSDVKEGQSLNISQNMSDSDVKEGQSRNIPQNVPELKTVNTGVKDSEENRDVPRNMPELITDDAGVKYYEGRHGQQDIPDSDVKDNKEQLDMSDMLILNTDIKPSISELMEYSELFTSRERISESRRKEAQVRYPLRKIPNPREACTIEEMRYLRRKFYQYKRYQRHFNKSFKAWELPKTRIVKLKSDGSKFIAVKRFSVPTVPPKEIPKQSRGSLLISDNFEDL